MSAVSEKMLIDAVDETDTSIGSLVRAEVFKLHANFRVAHVFVFNSEGELLIQRLGLNRTRHPGYWGSSVAAYLFSHEDYQSAAKRRLSEELGISNTALQFISKISMQDEGCTKFISLFKTVYDGPLHYDRLHIDEAEFHSLAEIRKMIVDGNRPFTPTFLYIFNSFQAALPLPT
jgi:isopentenyl-diphosphate delta-isomerase